MQATASTRVEQPEMTKHYCLDLRSRFWLELTGHKAIKGSSVYFEVKKHFGLRGAPDKLYHTLNEYCVKMYSAKPMILTLEDRAQL